MQLNLKLTTDEISLLKTMISTASLTPQGMQGGTIIPTAKLIVSISDKLDALGSSSEPKPE